MLTRSSTPLCSVWLADHATRQIIGVRVIADHIQILANMAESIMKVQPVAIVICKHCTRLPAQNVTTAIIRTVKVEVVEKAEAIRNG